jgi:hypothetical protein
LKEGNAALMTKDEENLHNRFALAALSAAPRIMVHFSWRLAACPLILLTPPATFPNLTCIKQLTFDRSKNGVYIIERLLGQHGFRHY